MSLNTELGEGPNRQNEKQNADDVKPPQLELVEQTWYWGNASKEVIAFAMEGRPTGTFAVRDASTPGDYTLTLRIDNKNKLVRIYVKDGHAGFTAENLEFDSVVALIEHYCKCSLEEFNAILHTSLKFPLSRENMPKLSDLIKDEERSSSERSVKIRQRSREEPKVRQRSTEESRIDAPKMPRRSQTLETFSRTQQGERRVYIQRLGRRVEMSKARPKFSSLTWERGYPSPILEEPILEEPKPIKLQTSRTSIDESETSKEKSVRKKHSKSCVQIKNFANLKKSINNPENRKPLLFAVEHFLESFVAEMHRTERRLGELHRQLDKLDWDAERHKKASTSYTNSLSLLYGAKHVMEEYLKVSGDEKSRKSVASNHSILDRRIAYAEAMKTKSVTGLDVIRDLKESLTKEEELMQKRFAIVKARCETYCKELAPYGVTKSLYMKKTYKILPSMWTESRSLLQNLLRVDLITSPFDWLTINADKSYSNDLVVKAVTLLKKRGVTNTDGVFMIRSSVSHPGFFAMVVSMDDQVYNCLIEYKPPHKSRFYCGYGFLNTRLYYTTLADFIRYYSLVTLDEHNENLKTVLRIPAIKYLATVRKHQHAGESPIDEEDDLRDFKNVELDFSDFFTLNTDAIFERNLQNMIKNDPGSTSSLCVL